MQIHALLDQTGQIFQLDEALQLIASDTLSELDSHENNTELRCQTFSSLQSLLEDVANKRVPRARLLLLSTSFVASSPAEKIASIRESYADNTVPIVMIASADNSVELVEAMRAGAEDYFLQDTPAKLIAVKLQAQIRASNVQSLLAQQHDSIRANHAHIVREQQMAKEVFDRVAHDLVDLDNIRYWLSPIAVFNGDVLLATPTPSGGLLVLMGDFTGHGLGAAIGAIPLASTFYGMAQKGFAVQDIVKELNAKLHGILPTGVFCCACVAEMDFASGVAHIWNAGLPDCYLLKEASGELQAVSSSTLALGILSPQAFSFEGTRVNISEGDKLYLLSDGMLETENESGEQYGEQRLKQQLTTAADSNGSSCFERVKDDVLNFIGEHQRADDISLVEVTVVSADAFSELHAHSNQLASQQPVSWCISYEFRADSLKHRDPIPLVLHALLEEPNLRQHSGRLFTIVSELFNNALDHGLLELSSELKQQQGGFSSYYDTRMQRLAQLTNGSIRFELDYRADEHSGVLIVDVIDSGEGFDHRHTISKKEAVEPALHGRGLALIRSICAELDILGSGNHVRAQYVW